MPFEYISVKDIKKYNLDYDKVKIHNQKYIKEAIKLNNMPDKCIESKKHTVRIKLNTPHILEI